ncbi:hypothetical protein EXT47_08470 [Pseudoalteromonas sp. CO342X]|uniref:hypothetical protein n=1 Tax=Pseudoalteromonas sp. CO342X TaxID=1777270 RepID=UPI001023D4CE|nr:hypothetical protein [Pseudoalteromonas sp. CO342X]RZG16102.1 hypothetical protein EXT47_08470 [Pseudoalteromonas sp. CO342X]
MFEPTSIDDVRQALKEVEDIERPDADNEGDPLNSPSVYDYLSPENQEKVDHAVEVVCDYVRNSAGEPNKRSITTLNNNGFSAHFNQDQYDPYRYVGSVTVGEWEIDVSDPSSGEEC